MLNLLNKLQVKCLDMLIIKALVKYIIRIEEIKRIREKKQIRNINQKEDKLREINIKI